MLKAVNDSAQIAQPFSSLGATLATSARKRKAWTLATLKRTLEDDDFQRELLTERANRDRGYPARLVYPHWALDLAAAMQNPAGEYSPECQQHILDICKNLYDRSASGSDLSGYIAAVADGNAAVVSPLAKELMLIERTAAHSRRLN